MLVLGQSVLRPLRPLYIPFNTVLRSIVGEFNRGGFLNPCESVESVSNII